MKKLLAMVLVLGFASTAFGANFQWRVGGVDTTEVTLAPSDTITIELWLAAANNGFFASFAGLSTELAGGQAEEGFVLESVSPGPALAFDTTLMGVVTPGLPIGGTAFQVYSETYEGIPDARDYLLLQLEIHCAGPNTITILGLNNMGGIAGTTDQFDSDYPAADLNYAGAKITINQIPEPASLALLALGGLALIRRR